MARGMPPQAMANEPPRTVEQASVELRDLEDKISKLCQEFTSRYCTEMWITDIGLRLNVPCAPFPLVKVTVELGRACNGG